MSAYACTRMVCIGLLRKVRFMVLDVPNERSSHVRPVPKGGGLAILVGVLVGVLLWTIVPDSFGGLTFRMSATGIGMVVLLAGMAALGFASDRRDMSPAIRLAVQAMLCAVAAWVLHVPVPWVPVWTLGMVAVVNFYNFMDGIDGIAAVQGMVSGLTIAAAGVAINLPEAVVIGIVLACACLGFLAFNVSPAKMFMGDVGSYSIGFILVVTVVYDPRLVVPVVFSLAVFLFDTTVTLARRVWRRERWYAAHRSHFYQRAVRTGFSHMQVTAVVGGLGIILGGMGVLFVTAGTGMRIVLLVCAVLFPTAAAVLILHRERQMMRFHRIIIP